MFVDRSRVKQILSKIEENRKEAEEYFCKKLKDEEQLGHRVI